MGKYLKTLMKTIAVPDNVLTFLHNAPTIEIAQEILHNGFLFNSHIDYTTDCVSAKDIVTVKYFTITRQAYGKFTVIIQIGKEIIEHYASVLKNKKHHFSEILSIKKPFLNNEDEFVFQLAPQFVRGFIDAEMGELHENKYFDPNFRTPIFDDNLNQMLKENEFD